jgi:hypothetical protein
MNYVQQKQPGTVLYQIVLEYEWLFRSALR